MPTWLSETNYYLKIENNLYTSRLVQLATVGLDNNPSVRTVVFRGWTESHEMIIFTDKRSEKFIELTKNKNVEICWFFPTSKCQFRFRGLVNFVSVDDSLFYWNQLDTETKKMWTWPNPGKKYEIDNNLKISKNIDQSDNFCLLEVRINHVDQLILKKPIHFRRQWIRQKNWIEERINP